MQEKRFVRENPHHARPRWLMVDPLVIHMYSVASGVAMNSHCIVMCQGWGLQWNTIAQQPTWGFSQLSYPPYGLKGWDVGVWLLERQFSLETPGSLARHNIYKANVNSRIIFVIYGPSSTRWGMKLSPRTTQKMCYNKKGPALTQSEYNWHDHQVAVSKPNNLKVFSIGVHPPSPTS